MENQNTPLWDASLDINERLDWLLEALNLDEKCRMFSTLTPEVARLGIRSTYLGEEAAHGVEAKHDRSVNWGAPKPTTTFPQPFGMSQTWDTKLMEKMGAAVGDEARILYYREGEHGGLCRWAPMAEPERDPRFGRTEEGFGEDPHLGGQMASAYIKGMRGDNPNYIKTAATISAAFFFEIPLAKHAYCTSSSRDPSNQKFMNCFTCASKNFLSLIAEE